MIPLSRFCYLNEAAIPSQMGFFFLLLLNNGDSLFLIASRKLVPFSFWLPHVVSAKLIVTGQSCKFWETRLCTEVVC